MVGRRPSAAVEAQPESARLDVDDAAGWLPARPGGLPASGARPAVVVRLAVAIGVTEIDDKFP